MVGVGDNRSEPMRSVLIDGTQPEYHAGNGASGQSVLPGLLVYKSGTIPNNEVTVCAAFHGSSMEDQGQIYIVEIPRSHPSFSQSYAKTTAFTAETDGFRMHKLKVGDRCWLKASSLTVSENDIVGCHTGGLVIQWGGDTPDKYNIHCFSVIGVWASATWIQGEYRGQMTVDAAS